MSIVCISEVNVDFLVQNANAVWILHAAWILCLKMLKVLVSRSAVKSESFKAETISETFAFKLP